MHRIVLIEGQRSSSWRYRGQTGKMLKFRIVCNVQHRGKLGNGEHLSLEAYKYEENNIYVLTIIQHEEEVKFYPETQIYRYSFSR